MIKSMTGYGFGSTSDDLNQINVDIKALNSRFLDYKIRGLNINSAFEEKIKRELSVKIKRGFVSIKFEIVANNQNLVMLNKDRFESFLRIIDKIDSDYKVKIKLSDVINLNDILITKDIIHFDEDKLFDTFKIALKNLIKMRLVEGNEIEIDIKKRIDLIKTFLLKIEDLSKKFSQLKFSQIKQKIIELVDDNSIDESRIIQEVAIMAEKIDISEEITRCKIHLNQLNSYLHNNDSIGKKINFILQELNREVNTLGSKSSNVDITSNMIEIKSELEKIREQNQNIL